MASKVKESSQPKYQSDKLSGWKPVVSIVVALIVWATVLVCGALLKEWSIWRPLAIFAALFTFCGVWIVALYAKHSKP